MMQPDIINFDSFRNFEQQKNELLKQIGELSVEEHILLETICGANLRSREDELEYISERIEKLILEYIELTGREHDKI